VSLDQFDSILDFKYVMTTFNRTSGDTRLVFVEVLCKHAVTWILECRKFKSALQKSRERERADVSWKFFRTRFTVVDNTDHHRRRHTTTNTLVLLHILYEFYAKNPRCSRPTPPFRYLCSRVFVLIIHLLHLV